MNTIWSDFARMIFHVEVEVDAENGDGAPGPAQYNPAGSSTRGGRVSYSGGAGTAQPSALAAAAAGGWRRVRRRRGLRGGAASRRGAAARGPGPAAGAQRPVLVRQRARNSRSATAPLSGGLHRHRAGRMRRLDAVLDARPSKPVDRAALGAAVRADGHLVDRRDHAGATAARARAAGRDRRGHPLRAQHPLGGAGARDGRSPAARRARGRAAEAARPRRPGGRAGPALRLAAADDVAGVDGHVRAGAGPRHGGRTAARGRQRRPRAGRRRAERARRASSATGRSARAWARSGRARARSPRASRRAAWRRRSSTSRDSEPRPPTPTSRRRPCACAAARCAGPTRPTAPARTRAS